MNEDELTEGEEESSSKRERSPSFPYLDLETSIDLARKLHSAARASEVRVRDVAEPWGMQPKSGSLMRYIAALGQYGLIESRGSGEQRKIKISAPGRRILEDDRPGVREELCAEAAIKPRIIKDVFYGKEGFSGWGKHRPADHIALSDLKFDFNFTDDAAKRFLGVYDQTIEYVDDENIDESALGQDVDGEVATPSDEETPKLVLPGLVTAKPAVQNPRVGDKIQWTSGDVDQFPAPQTVRAISDDGQWLFVHGSTTGISVREAIVIEKGEPSHPVDASKRPEMPLPTPSKPTHEQDALNKINFQSQGDGTITVSARLDAEGLAKLETMLPAFKALLS